MMAQIMTRRACAFDVLCKLCIALSLDCNLAFDRRHFHFQPNPPYGIQCQTNMQEICDQARRSNQQKNSNRLALRNCGINPYIVKYYSNHKDQHRRDTEQSKIPILQFLHRFPQLVGKEIPEKWVYRHG